MRGRHGHALLISAFFLTIPIVGGRTCASIARADPTPLLDLQWPSVDGCPSRDEVMAQVLQRVPKAPPGPVLQAAAQIALGSNGLWTVRLTTRGASNGERTIEGNSCAAVARATAVILALVLDPNATGALSSSSAAASVAPSTSGAAPTVSVSSSSADSPPARDPGLPIVRIPTVGVVVSGGLLPGTSAGLAISFGEKYRWFRGDVLLAASPSRHIQVEGTQARASWTYLAAGARGCGGAGTSSQTFWLGGCLGLSEVRVLASSTSIRKPDEGGAWIPAVLPGGLFTAAITSAITLELAGGPMIPLTRPKFVIDGVGEIYRPSVIAWETRFDLAWHF